MTPSVKDLQRVTAVLEIMISKVDRADPFALAVDSAAVGRRQLERSFEALKTTPHRELCRIRVELGVGELTSGRGGSIHLEGVAHRLGYRDERRLREAMGKTYGLSPSQIRRGARIERKLKRDQKIRARQRGFRPVGLWSSAYRRRRNREELQRILQKANSQGAKVILNQVSYPRPSTAREEASELARNRVLQLYAAVRQQLRSVA